MHYIAPEQARGDGKLDVRADIYALGATLYHLTTGSLPFEGTSEEVLAKQVLESLSGERIRDLDLSPQLHYFLEKMMAKEPEMRFQDPEQLQREIGGFLEQRRAQSELEAKAERSKPRLGELVLKVVEDVVCFGDYDAVVSAAISRLRPILMSMTTTVLGLLPLIISRDPLFYGLACVMAWGLAIGTVFTLVVVPTLYTLFFSVPIPRAPSTK